MADSLVPALSLGDVAVRQFDGLFSLNDLHAAAGGAVRHQPTRFMRLDSTQALIAEIAHSPEMVNGVFQVIKGSVNPGTYACRELVIAYAAWISAAFHLRVIRVFLAQPALATLPAAPAKARRWLMVSEDGQPPTVAELADDVQIGNWSQLAELLATREPGVYRFDEHRVALAEAAARVLFDQATHTPTGAGAAMAKTIHEAGNEMSVADLRQIAIAASSALWAVAAQEKRGAQDVTLRRRPALKGVQK